MDLAERNSLIEFYFRLGLTYVEILALLACRHNYVLSERSLHRLLRERDLYRRRNQSDLLDVACFIEEQLCQSGGLHGYRWMHGVCTQAGFTISKEHVRLLLTILDSRGVAIRASRRLRRREYNAQGPNNLWHFDGYDKLKPYGLCIHGCIDGFSRMIIWLRVSYTNNDPKVVAGYFIESVERLGGVPKKLRCDRGTENSIVEILYKFLYDAGIFMYGRSTANQRIESWWGILRRHCSQFWMDTFSELKDNGHFSGSFCDKNIIRFCFMNIIQVLHTQNVQCHLNEEI